MTSGEAIVGLAMGAAGFLVAAAIAIGWIRVRRRDADEEDHPSFGD